MIGANLKTDAQVLNGYVKSKSRTATNRAVYDADKEVDSQINKGVDKEFNKLMGKVLGQDDESSEAKEETAVEEVESESSESNNSSSDRSSGNDAMSKALMGKMGLNMTRPENMKDVYEYTGNIRMDVESWDDEGNSDGPIDYKTMYSDKNSGFAMEFKDKEKGKSLMIFDYDNKLMLILADDGQDKNGFATPIEASSEDLLSSEESEQVSDEDAEKAEEFYSGFKKTGKSKTIAGYKCDEYFYEDEDAKMTYWMTNDLSKDLWSKMYSSNIFTSLYTGKANGFVMESDHQEKSSKERSHMIVKEVNPNQSSKISTVGYNVMQMSFAPGSDGSGEEGEKE